jgi:uncharacterized membrane protein
VNDWKVIPTIVLATVLIFGAGVVTGGILVDYVKQARPRMAAKRPNPAAPVNPVSTNNPVHAPQILRDKDFLQRLEGEMSLTKEEHETIQRIINENQNQMRKVIQDARLEIREALTPGHRQQFDELMKRPFHKPLFGTNAPPGAAPLAPTNAPEH